ncbi:hypothetical protein [Peredibacter starrii]|uniref:Histidine kinase n=1 Tax=Peredibacter starrii TaxID=28202 RepID=A0AAX4HN65_9BACT|nr:hypothetical protein [Peredibacter starrii]WPU64735.1 hypothetical protein SOO65_18745 [Peredibacter starrii]
MADQKREREFIHALASPLAGIEMILESVMDDIQDKGEDPEGYGERVREALNGLEKLKILLKERREEVLSDK